MTTPGVSPRARTPVAGALRGPARMVFACLLATLAACSHGTGAGPAPPAPPPPPTLEAVEGAVVEARLEPGEQHVFPLEMEEGTYVEVHVDRPERELTIDLFDPGVDPRADDSEPYVTGERATGHPGQMLWEVARHSGEHHLRVAAGARTIAYRLEVTDLRPATERDRSRSEGLWMFQQGQALLGPRPEDALEKFLEARELFVRGEYERGIAATYNREGQIRRNQGRRDEARAAHRAAAEHWRLEGDPVSEVTAWATLSSLDRDDGDYESAERHLETAEARARDEGDDEALARALLNYCRLYRDQHLTARALEACREALRICEALDLDDEMIATVLTIGQIHAGRGESGEARDLFARALMILERHPSPSLEATIRNGLALLRRNEGDHLGALGFFREALDLYETDSDTIRAARVMFNMGSTHALLGDLDKTLELYSEALRRMQTAGDKIGRVEVLRGIAWAQRERGDLEAAQRALDQAIALSPETENRFLLAYSHQQTGEMRLELGNPSAAVESLLESKRLYEAIDNRWQLAAVLGDLAAAYRVLGRHEDALASLGRAIEINQQLEQRSGLAASYYQMAKIERDRGDPAAALGAISKALDFAEQLRGNAGTEDFQALYSATVEPYHDLKIDLLMGEHLRDPTGEHANAALHASERAKAQSLREIIVESDLDLEARVPDPLRRERVELRAEIESHQRRRRLVLIGNSPDPEQLLQVRLDLERALLQLQEVEREIRETSPRYADLTDPEPVSVDEIRSSLLDDETALLEYNLGDDRSFLWLVTREAMKTYVLPGRDALDQDARCLHRLIRAYGDPPSLDALDEGLESCLGRQAEDYRRIDPGAFPPRVRGRRRQELEFAFQRTAARLSEALLGDAMRDAPLPLRLAVVSDGALEYVPFAALPLPADPQRPATEPAQVVDRHEVVRLPSASVLAVQRRQNPGPDVPPPGLVAIVADPVYNPDDPRVEAAPIGPAPQEALLVEDFRSIEQLPFPRRLELSGNEARAIASLVPEELTLVLEGFEATPDRVAGDHLGDYLYVHFATHGEIDTEYPKLSSLVLSQVDRAGRRVEDGDLRLQDIYGMDLDDVDMVVLSACETALGREVRGEGLMGLTRGFLYAGAERVAATLWQVQDVMTAELMEHFYRGLFEEDRAPADALRHAQLAVRDSDEGDYSFPYYWAGFVLQGEWR